MVCSTFIYGFKLDEQINVDVKACWKSLLLLCNNETKPILMGFGCAVLCYGLCCSVVYSRVKRLRHTCIVYGTAMILTPTKQRSWAFILFPFQFDWNENSNRSCVPCTHSFNFWFRCECVGWIFEHVINEWDHTNGKIPIFLKIVHHIEYTISNCDRCLNEYLFLSHS